MDGDRGLDELGSILAWEQSEPYRKMDKEPARRDSEVTERARFRQERG